MRSTFRATKRPRTKRPETLRPRLERPQDRMILGQNDPRMKHPLGDGKSVLDFCLTKWTKRPRYFWDFCPFLKPI
jgi:hypothetical protein